MLAGSLTMLIATSALGIDAGTMFLEKRRLQGIADAAAMAAAGDPSFARAAAQRTIDANGGAPATIDRITPGIYAADPDIAHANRFTPTTLGANAVEVRLAGSVPTFFGRIITGDASAAITATATAARVNIASFSLGTGMAAVSGGIVNSLLSGLAGTNLELSAIDFQGLASTRVDLLRVSEAVRASLDLAGADFDETLATSLPLPDAVRAMATAAAADAGTASLLTRIAERLPNRTIMLSDAIDLGPLGSKVAADPRREIAVDTLSMLRALMTLWQEGRQIDTNATLDLPGLASARIATVIGDRARQSAWVTVGAAGDAELHSAQTRILIEVTLLDLLPLGLGKITLPVYIETAAASARLTAVSCIAGRDKAQASIAVTPSLGSVEISPVDTDRLRDFSTPVDTMPATIAASPLARVRAQAMLPIGGMTTQVVNFDADDIATHRPKSVSSQHMTQGLATALIDRATIETKLLGTSLPLPVVDAATRATLLVVAASLDLLVDQVLGIAGVKVGTATTWINGVRCGTPQIVA